MITASVLKELSHYKILYFQCCLFYVKLKLSSCVFTFKFNHKYITEKKPVFCTEWAMRYFNGHPEKQFTLMMMMMMMIMMMMMNCLCGMVDRRKAFSLISRRDHCHRSSPSQISDTPRVGLEPALNLSSGLVEWRFAVVITTITRCHKPLHNSATIYVHNVLLGKQDNILHMRSTKKILFIKIQNLTI